MGALNEVKMVCKQIDSIRVKQSGFLPLGSHEEIQGSTSVQWIRSNMDSVIHPWQIIQNYFGYKQVYIHIVDKSLQSNNLVL